MAKMCDSRRRLKADNFKYRIVYYHCFDGIIHKCCVYTSIGLPEGRLKVEDSEYNPGCENVLIVLGVSANQGFMK